MRDLERLNRKMETVGMRGKVSIIMPTFNCARYIAESIDSVLAQTYEDWELWIVDDQSEDDTLQTIERYLADERIRYVCLETHGGAAAARNRGLQLARGQYIAFLDSDDLWMPEKLEKQVDFLERHRAEGCHFCCAAYTKMDEHGRSLHTLAIPPKTTGYWKMYLLSNPIGNSTVLYDRDAFGMVQVPEIKKRNDYAMWLQMLRGGAVCYGMEESLARYRVRSGSISHNKLGLMKYHWILYRHIERHNLLVCALGICCWAFVKGTHIGLRIRRTDK